MMSTRCQPEPVDGVLSASPGDPALTDRSRPFCRGERGGRAEFGVVTACRAAASSICEAAEHEVKLFIGCSKLHTTTCELCAAGCKGFRDKTNSTACAVGRRTCRS